MLHRLLVSLRCAIEKLDKILYPFNLTIVDNGNNRNQLLKITEEFQNDALKINLINNAKNIGYGKAHNKAILEASSKYHLILNPDVILDPFCLKNGLEYLKNNPTVGVISPKIKSASDELQFPVKRYPALLDLAVRAIGLHFLSTLFSKRLARYQMQRETLQNTPFNAELVSGCFLLCTTDKLQAIGGFDERYFLYFEDFALSIELSAICKLVYLPTVQIIHYGGNTAKKGIKHIVLFLTSAIKFYNRYGWKLF